MPYRTIRSIIADQILVVTSPHTSVAKAALLMKKGAVGAVLVMQGKRLCGIFTERDALFRVLAEGRDSQTTQLADVMTPDPQTIHPDKFLGHALHLMFEGGFRHMPVVENGHPIGMVSARDSLSLELREFADEMEDRVHITEILG